MSKAAENLDLRDPFLKAATWHDDLAAAEKILAEQGDLASLDIFTAAVLGDDVAVRRFLAEDRACAKSKGGLYDAEAIVSLSHSKYLRLDKSRRAAFLRAATAWLDAGADPNAGFWTKGEYPEFETALFDAAGIAHHAGTTPASVRALLDAGAVL